MLNIAHYGMFAKIDRALKKNGYAPKYVFDIGANRGEWTRSMLTLFPDAQYHLFDPVIYHEIHTIRGRDKIKISHTLLSDKEEEVDWYEQHTTGDSMFRELTPHYMNTVPIKKRSVLLNRFFEPEMSEILIKIDCQGAEIPILKGASKFYEKTDFIILEVPFFGKYNQGVSSFFDHIKFMDEIGFVVYELLDEHDAHGFTVQLDLMFINKKHRFNQEVQYRLNPSIRR